MTTAANAIFLQSTAPIYLLVLGPLILREPVRRRDIVYVCAIAAGMILCLSGQPDATTTAPNPRVGNLLGLACGLVWSLTLVGLRWAERGGGREGIGLTAVVAGNAMASLGALPFALPFPPEPLSAWATAVYLGVFQIGAAYLCLTTAIRHVRAFDVSLLLLLEPVLNPLWTWMVRGEEPGGRTILGGAVIVAAAAIKSVHDSRMVTTQTQTG
jgi:drug/metabolite transporter, DME family